jgi:hypothetical protein
VAGKIHDLHLTFHLADAGCSLSIDFAKAAARQFVAITAGSDAAVAFEADHARQIFCIGSISEAWAA